MKKRVKHGTLLLLSLLFVFSTGACSAGTSGGQKAVDATRPKIIYVNTGARDTEVTKAILAGVIKASKEENCEIVF